MQLLVTVPTTSISGFSGSSASMQTQRSRTFPTLSKNCPSISLSSLIRTRTCTGTSAILERNISRYLMNWRKVSLSSLISSLKSKNKSHSNEWLLFLLIDTSETLAPAGDIILFLIFLFLLNDVDLHRNKFFLQSLICFSQIAQT